MKYLETNLLTNNTNLVKHLPPDLAFRHHALLLAEENEYVTVAMANPEDLAAKEAISAYLGRPVYAVHSDREKIDAKLSEIWPGEHYTEKLSVLVCAEKTLMKGNGYKPSNDHQIFIEYSTKFCNLIRARISHLDMPVRSKVVRERLVRTVADSDYDLVVVSRFPRSSFGHLLLSPLACDLSIQICTSMLVVQEPRWPLRQVLLALRFDQIDETAVSWTRILAQLCDATVTILPITPLFPAMYRDAVCEMLSPVSTSGRWFQKIIQQFEDLNVPLLIHHHHDISNRQIQAEVSFRSYDLVVIGGESTHWAVRWFAGGLVKPLLLSASCPVLITKRAV
jgi:nucleotide-binding universal stress UspA family protein